MIRRAGIGLLVLLMFATACSDGGAEQDSSTGATSTTSTSQVVTTSSSTSTADLGEFPDWTAAIEFMNAEWGDLLSPDSIDEILNAPVGCGVQAEIDRAAFFFNSTEPGQPIEPIVAMQYYVCGPDDVFALVEEAGGPPGVARAVMALLDQYRTAPSA